MSDVRDQLIAAAASLLRPLAKRLLAMGVTFGQLEGRMRELFVEVAETDLALPGRRQTDSRIALVTGINRKEVRRIRASEGEALPPRSFGMNHATSLISRWMTDPRAADSRGRPRPLPYNAARGMSFMKLARKVTGDLSPGILLDELVRAGSVEVDEQNVVRLRADSYVPQLESSEALQVLREDPPELVETILRNIFAKSSDLLLQRKVYYDNLGSDSAARVRVEVRREGARFLQRVNRLLAKHDRDRSRDAAGGSRYYASVGVYYFEEPEQPESGPSQAASQSKEPA
jgi:hypothetical protein